VRYHRAGAVAGSNLLFPLNATMREPFSRWFGRTGIAEVDATALGQAIT